jgi:hypothetical protein
MVLAFDRSSTLSSSQMFYLELGLSLAFIYPAETPACDLPVHVPDRPLGRSEHF